MTINPLENLIIQKIKSQGPIPFDEFMQIVLYYPGLGYYMKEDFKIGRQGDFFTASHLGKVFGIILTKALFELWQKMGCPDNFSITEIGPGMGYLAQDILEEIQQNKVFSHIVFKYNLIEINPELMKIQKERLKDYSEKTIWYNTIEEVTPFEGIVICNEILDALPVRIFEIKNKKPFEVYVTVDKNENLSEILMPARDDTVDYLEKFAACVFQLEEYRSEINLVMKEFIEKVSSEIKRGYVLIFDYGFDSSEYFSPERTRGTLLCYCRHTINDNPYTNIGQQDITSHVNFSALEKWAKETGFNVENYTSQSKFLISLCDENLLMRLDKEGLINKFKRLVLPHGMGETHRVMILSKF